MQINPLAINKLDNTVEAFTTINPFKILNLIDAELNNGSKDYDKDFIRKHVEKLTS